MHIEIERQINLGLHPVHVHVPICTGRERRACRFDRREASTGRRRRRRPAPSAVPVDPTVSHAASLPPCKHRYLQHTKLQEEEKSPISAPRASSTSYSGTNDKTERKRSQSERSLSIFLSFLSLIATSLVCFIFDIFSSIQRTSSLFSCVFLERKDVNLSEASLLFLLRLSLLILFTSSFLSLSCVCCCLSWRSPYLFLFFQSGRECTSQP